ncbi:ATP-dependent DNA helicase Q4 [Phytophthora nicotianae]|uniref:Hexose transporter 1 n=1 Tax=Phytophthora nicotianae TaxID=4792 RepID=A0A0W8DJS3_PHYNI|nr:ATP-dependent DNA helicase Q4 [Phytophthora nicotianae]
MDFSASMISSTSGYVWVAPTPMVMMPAPAIEEETAVVKPTWRLYANILVAVLQALQFGWSTSQMNNSIFNNEVDCNARPIAPGTCLMFPGHTKTEWTIAVSSWIVGGMIGSLLTGRVSNKFGRKPTMMANCLFMIAGISFGRYLSSNHQLLLRGYQQRVAVHRSVPVLNAGFFLAFAPFVLVESPAWLLEKGDRERAEQEIARLYGHGFVPQALSWMEPSVNTDLESEPLSEEQQYEGGTLSLLFSPLFIKQLLVALGVSAAQQLTGINAVCYYSSDIFSDAGVSDGRVGGVIVYVLMLLPTMAVARLSERFGNRRLLLTGLAGMFISATGITLALALSVEVLSIVFMGTFVAFFSVSVGPLIWPITAALFTDSVRATAVSMCIFINWVCNLIIGVFFPYVSDALDEYKFVPFMVTTAAFFFFTQFWIPETAGKSTEEIQATFRPAILTSRIGQAECV